MTLDELIAALESADPTQVCPAGFNNPHSYRGYYTDLAFEPASDITVGEMLAAARSALGTTYIAWKGGDYQMTGDSDCWLSQVGSASEETLSATLMKLMLNASTGKRLTAPEGRLAPTARETLLQLMAEWFLTTGHGSREKADAILAQHRVEVLAEAATAVRDQELPYIGDYVTGWRDAGKYITALCAEGINR